MLFFMLQSFSQGFLTFSCFGGGGWGTVHTKLKRQPPPFFPEFGLDFGYELWPGLGFELGLSL